MKNAIEIKGLCKNYDGFRLDHVDLALPEGAIMGRAGENGAGKSTTIKAMLGLLHIDSGEVALLGRPGEKALEGVGVVFDSDTFPENMNAKDVDAVMKNIYAGWDKALFWQYAKRFSLPEKQPIKEYSRGMKMKLAIAAALARRPKLLVLDEATSGLDPVVRNQILDIFLEFIQEEDHSVLLSSHITSDLEKICDYITFLHQGQVVFSLEKDVLEYRYGAVRCTKEEFARLDKAHVVAYRENMFGCELLTNDRDAFLSANPGCTAEQSTIEEIMLFYVEGKKC